MSNYTFDEEKIKNLTSDTESTSAISTIAYEIENARYNGVENQQIKEQVNELKGNGNFPSNLQFIDAKYDKATSLCAVAFQDTNTGNVTVGFAGTNLSNGLGESAKDVGQWGAIAFSSDSASSPYFSKGDEFIKGLQKDGYLIDTVTGHSLGGRNGAILGMSNNIPNIVLYNAAPLRNNLAQGLASGIGSNPFKDLLRLYYGIELDNIIKNYDGRLVYMISEKDPLNSVAGLFGSLYPGEKFVIQNGKGHDMAFFLDREAQAFIKRKLTLVDENGRVISGAEAAKAFTTARMNALKSMKKDLLAKGGGSLTGAQKIYLDAMEAKTITEGMIMTTQDKIAEMKKMYERSIENAEELWQTTKSDAAGLGEHLSSAEEISALASGNATEASILTEPVQLCEAAMSKLTSYEGKFTSLLSDIETAIQKQVAVDQELAAYLG
ncbi:hypothetical protein I6N96_13720 [Enterococcus sp. BWM-S5]|uniref:Fungal lipase-like domain-containing protein n=1 Tax=Enterococcus larvae TaxID=2794352 RepID=A0ABS4CM39_9ENTE|nr:hypothetical protein [Enterococcus larvae]MBP1047337.1 hypothetical protein [Enterococcus larvae]